MRHGRFCKTLNKNFRGITMDVMDIYPVIKYCEIKFAERLAVIKEVDNTVNNKRNKRNEHNYEEMSYSDEPQEVHDKTPSGEDNFTEVIIHHERAKDNEKTKNDEKVKNGVSDLTLLEEREANHIESNCEKVINHTDGVNRRKDDITELPAKQKRRKHSYDLVDFEDGFGRVNTERKDSKHSTNSHKSSVHEVFDLAIQSSTRSHAEESLIIEALDLDVTSSFRERSSITISCKPSQENSLNDSIKKIAQQRSLQVSNELAKSSKSGEGAKNIKASVNSKKEQKFNCDSQSSQSTFTSNRNNSHLSHSSRLSYKRYDIMFFNVVRTFAVYNLQTESVCDPIRQLEFRY